MATNELKSTVAYDKLNRKNTIKVGETWMHGSLGVVTIDRIYRMDNKAFSTTVWYTDKKGTQWAACAADMGAGHWAIKENFLFKVA